MLRCDPDLCPDCAGLIRERTRPRVQSASPSSLTSVSGFSDGAEPRARGRVRSPKNLPKSLLFLKSGHCQKLVVFDNDAEVVGPGNSSLRFLGRGRLQTRQRSHNGLLHQRIVQISQMSALGEDGQLFRAKGGAEPGHVLVRQEKIVLIDDDADAGVGAQAGVVGPQIAGGFQRFRGHAGRA